MALYHLVQFIEEDQVESIEIVPDPWIENKDVNNGNQCNVAFPPKSEYHNIRTLIREANSPKSTWQSYNGCILYSSGEFQNNMY